MTSGTLLFWVIVFLYFVLPLLNILSIKQGKTQKHQASIFLSHNITKGSDNFAYIRCIIHSEQSYCSLCTLRPDTSRRQWRWLPTCLWLLPLCPLYPSRNLQFPHRVSFTKEKIPWCPCHFKNEAYRTVSVKLM